MNQTKNMNSYLQPLVEDLKDLWKGVFVPSASGISVFIRCALICTSCDILANRKVSGFVGHNAYHACSRCLKAFPTSRIGEKAGYTGTDRVIGHHIAWNLIVSMHCSIQNVRH